MVRNVTLGAAHICAWVLASNPPFNPTEEDGSQRGEPSFKDGNLLPFRQHSAQINTKKMILLLGAQEPSIQHMRFMWLYEGKTITCSILGIRALTSPSWGEKNSQDLVAVILQPHTPEVSQPNVLLGVKLIPRHQMILPMAKGDVRHLRDE